MVGSEVVQRVEMRDDAQGRMRRPGTCILGFAFLGVNVFDAGRACRGIWKVTARFAVELSGAWNYAFNRFDTPLRIGCTSPALAIWSTSFRRNSTTP